MSDEITPPVVPDPRLEELAKQTKSHAQATAKFAQERRDFESQRSEHLKERSEYDEWKRLQADRLRNPVPYLKKDFGDDWYNSLTKLQLEGTPPTNLIASELEERETRWNKQMEEQKSELDKRFKELEAREWKKQADEYVSGAVTHAKDATKYPHISKMGAWDEIRKTIEDHWHATAKDGEPGVVLTPEEAASKLEERFADYAKKLAPPSMEPQRNGTLQRRNLSTSLSAKSNPQAAPVAAKSDRDRLQKALAAWDADVASRG